MECSNGYCENVKNKLEKKERKMKVKDLFEKPNKKPIKCPKGHKICMCNPKKPKCKKIKKKK